MPEKMKPCPIEGCPTHWRTKEGLRGHLYRLHRKSEIVKALLDGVTIQMCMVYGKVEVKDAKT